VPNKHSVIAVKAT